MFELSTLDNYRYGTFAYGGKKIKTPAVLLEREDILFLGDISIQKPRGLLAQTAETDLRTAPLMRLPFRLPHSVAERMMRENVRLLGKESYNCIPLSISSHRGINEEFFSHLPEADIFFFPRCEERAFVESVARLREKFPSTLFYTPCTPDEVPVYLMLGFDLFYGGARTASALETFAAHPTKQYVEREVNSSIHTKRLLRFIYSSYDCYERYTKTKREKEIYISSDSLKRPEVERFRRTVAERFIPLSRLFVLLPCSARKPYSRSPSHMKFIDALRRGAGTLYPSLTQLVLTSPLGVVPRDLEELVDYDTVVTGEWSHEEISSARRVLERIVSKTQNPIFIAHLPEEYREICAGLPDVKETCVGNPSSRDSLETLAREVKNAVSSLSSQCGGWMQRVRHISRFMFDEDIFPEDLSIRGRAIRHIFSGKKRLAAWDRYLSPTLEGAQRMSTYWVDIDFKLRGDVFCVGVLDADPRIRAGDVVCVRREGEACGVGKAVLPGSLMNRMKAGKAVSVTHTH